jgi:hypothetical protein
MANRVAATVTGNADWLALTKPANRNRLLRDAMDRSAREWRKKYLPQRFTGRMRRAPFNWILRRGAAWSRFKATALPVLIKHNLGGWDPNGDVPAIRAPYYAAWLKRQQAAGRYTWSRTGMFGGAQAEYYAETRKMIKVWFSNWYANAKHLPLVSTGLLRSIVGTGQIKAVSTSTRGVMATVTVPRADRQNPVAVSFLGSVTADEQTFVGEHFAAQVAALRAANPAAPPMMPKPTRATGQTTARATGSRKPRKIA